jgi:hypothetical protein
MRGELRAMQRLVEPDECGSFGLSSECSEIEGVYAMVSHQTVLDARSGSMCSHRGR